MTRDGLRKIMDSTELSVGEKDYIFNYQYHMGGSFTQALYEAISRADEGNLHKLSLGFATQVQGFLAWTRGDLHERASAIAGGDCGFISDGPRAEEEATKTDD